MTTKMKTNRLIIVLVGIAGAVIFFTSPTGFVCGMFWFYVIEAVIYLGWPIILFRLLAVQLGNYRIFKLVALVIAALLMSQYWAFGASLAVNHFGVEEEENLLSYQYASTPFLAIAPIAGAVSGFLLQLGARLHIDLEKVLFAGGCLVLLTMSLYTGFLILAPE